jgi:hypothetical protein
VPAALFAAVAQVLAWVYQLRASMRGDAAAPADLPELPVPPELDPHNKPRRRELTHEPLDAALHGLLGANAGQIRKA